MKFKVGDRVKVTKLCGIDKSFNIHIGDVGTVRRITQWRNYEVEFDNNNLSLYELCVSPQHYYIMYGNQLEKVEGEYEMTLENLRSGMVVETRDGNRFLVLVDDNELLFMNGDCETHIGNWDGARRYNSDLTHAYGFKNLDIMKVYARIYNFDMVSNPKVLLWERKEVKEMTVSEIEHVLGYSVKVVADHE